VGVENIAQAQSFEIGLEGLIFAVAMPVAGNSEIILIIGYAL
jgi:hypothetical protein